MSVALAAMVSAGCSRETGDDIVAKVGDASLTKAAIRAEMPAGLTDDDSLRFVNAYIRNWIDDRLVEEVAVGNIPDTRGIDRMVADYRRKLIMWEYRRLMSAEHGETQFPDDTLRAYYDRHSRELLTTEPIVRGLYIRVNDDDRHLPELRRLYRSRKPDDADKLEKAVTHDDGYSYFRDRWIPWKSVAARLPADIVSKAEDNAKARRPSDFSSGEYTYLIDITDYMPTGSVMPYEIAVPAITEKLRAESRAAYDMKLRRELYDKAVADGKIVIY
ncbi:MAG: hypothetical protein K2L49_07830 [Muribaculaceae bacterium]|nr:hypothetical protein [Muribaculaceae bacterium]